MNNRKLAWFLLVATILLGGCSKGIERILTTNASSDNLTDVSLSVGSKPAWVIGNCQKNGGGKDDHLYGAVRYKHGDKLTLTWLANGTFHSNATELPLNFNGYLSLSTLSDGSIQATNLDSRYFHHH